MKKILEYLFEQQHLSAQQAKDILGQIADGQYRAEEVSAFLTVFRMRSVSIQELIGFRDCLRERCIPIDLKDFDAIDLCGTGGDGKDTFNISTLASFVVAGAGYKVAKHGNYGVSSVCGSSNVLEHLGLEFNSDQDRLKRQLDQSNICFLHAPLFHPAMKAVAPIRKSIGVRTFFNILGPMVNPSLPSKQLVGVYSLQLQRYYKYIYERENTNYRIVHSFDGYDELSLTGPCKIISPEKEFILNPSDISPLEIEPTLLHGGKDIKSSADIFMDILSGKGTDVQNTVVCANAALAIDCFLPQSNYSEALALAKESLQSGAAFNSFQKLIAL